VLPVGVTAAPILVGCSSASSASACAADFRSKAVRNSSKLRSGRGYSTYSLGTTMLSRLMLPVVAAS
jgi:hypothetical protein